jgi:rod shape-determining protein MreC
MFLEAHAQPSADLDRSDEVLLLHDLAEPAGPPPPANPAGPPTSDAPPPPTSAAIPRVSLPAASSAARPASAQSTGVPQP